MPERIISGVVQRVIEDGKHGPYAIAKSEEIEGSITFSLEKNVWPENELPEAGTVVVLLNLRRKRAGWRALKVRFLQPSDEKANSADSN